MNRPSTLVSLPLVTLFACVSASHAEPAPVPRSQPQPQPKLESAAVPEPEPEPKPESAAEPEPEPEIADSDIQAGAVLEPGVAAGLVEFADELEAEGEQAGSLWVGKLEGNGGREVLIYIPPGADDAAPFELVFHFHGTYSETVQKKRPNMKKKREWVGWERLEQTLAALTELQAKRAYNVALVYPLSAGKRLEPGHRGWSNVAYDRMWMDPVAPPDYRDDFARLHDESVAVLQERFGVHPSKLPDGVIAEGHSAGGIALLNIALTGSYHVREYIFLDASFQSWADGCYAAVKDSGVPAKLTLVVTDKGMADPFEGRDPWCIDWAEAAALWGQKKSWCASRPDEEVAEIELSCAELEERAQEWREDYEDWCAAMKDGMQSVDAVTLIETKVFHKNMPRQFSGGLELPEDRWR
jgi:pimeloyl-ACP methyl ester carboxylesterase